MWGKCVHPKHVWTAGAGHGSLTKIARSDFFLGPGHLYLSSHKALNSMCVGQLGFLSFSTGVND